MVPRSVASILLLVKEIAAEKRAVQLLRQRRGGHAKEYEGGRQRSRLGVRETAHESFDAVLKAEAAVGQQSLGGIAVALRVDLTLHRYLPT